MVTATCERCHLHGGIVDLLNLSERTHTLIKYMNRLLSLLVTCVFTFYTFKYLFFVMKISHASPNLE